MIGIFLPQISQDGVIIMSNNNITKIFVNKKSIDSNIFYHAKNTFPQAQFVNITTNSKVLNEDHGLISMSWKHRSKQKNHFLAILHRESQWKLDPNGRSTDFLPSNMIQSGCAGYNCSYCYLDRHGPSFLKLYDDCYKFVDFCVDLETNKQSSIDLFKKVTGKDIERVRDPKHNPYITIDIGCDDQVTISNRVTKHHKYPGHIVDIINSVHDKTKEIMLSFASKDSDFTDFAPNIKDPSRMRIRLSLSPEDHRKVLELNTSKIEDRIKSINYLVDLGFEVHVNLSPIVVTDNFADEYAELLKQLDSGINDKAKAQLAYEIIFVTHSDCVNDNMEQFMPKAFNMIANGPLMLEPKWNKPNVKSYKRSSKDQLKSIMNGLIEEITPYSRIRYMF